MQQPAAAPVPARVGDVRAIVHLRDELARWQQSRGITQWAPGEVGQRQALEQVQRAEWWVLYHGNALAAAVRVLDQDPQIWPDSATARASYVHGLMVATTSSGQGLGARVLRWVESRAVSQGRERVRLDCVSTNHRLQVYYQRCGYQARGQVTFGPDSAWHPVTRFEKLLRADTPL